MTIKVEGMAELQAQLAELGDALTQQKTLRKAARKAFEPVLLAAQAKAPVRTGILRDSIVLSSPSKVDPNARGAAVVVGLRIKKTRDPDPAKDASWRWHFVERGTRNHPPHPFLRPALHANAQYVVDELRRLLKTDIDQIVRRNARNTFSARLGRARKKASRVGARIGRTSRKGIRAVKKTGRAVRKTVRKTARTVRKASRTARRNIRRRLK